MYKYLKKSLHAKILLLIISIMTIGVVISIAYELKSREKDLLEEKLRASRFIAKPVLNAIYEDMLEERADMARHLINTLGQVEGIELRIIRSNGIEEAFKDFKTIRDVEKEFGEVRPEWIENHPDVHGNIAKGVDSEEFKKAYRAFRKDWQKGPIYYMEYNSDKPFLTYLQPIEKKSKCNTCHTAEGARGILMIVTPLDDMYAILAHNRNQWIASGIIAIFFGGFFVSVLVKKSVTGPLGRTVDVIKRIADGGGGMSERVKVSSGDEVGYLTKAFNDMLDTLEKRDEENRKLFSLVEKSKEEWVATFDSIQDLISIHSRDSKIVRVNMALARKLNTIPEALVGRNCHEVFYGDGAQPSRCPHLITQKTHEASDTEADDLVFEGTYKINTFPVFNDRGDVWASVHIVRDITLEKLLREQLLHAEKLSSMGKLVAGIAHELNNPLMGIMGFSQIVMDTPGDKSVEEVKEKLGKIYHEATRTAKIVQNLLTFARAKKTERQYIDVNEIVRHTAELREYSLKANNIEVSLDLEKGLPKTMADPYQLQQVFINIMNNAEDAMVSHRGKGRIEIRTQKSRGRIVISFADDGPGIPKELAHRVFDPFFTTKEVGKGTGLGLSISHGIITEHGGTIEIGERDRGAAVIIRLPILEKELWYEVKKAVDGDVEPKVLTSRKVLVVDDEASIREALANILVKEGFKVETAPDGDKALEALGKDRFALIITDIKMPGLNGIELYNRVSEKYPHLKKKVIVLTGDVFSEDTKEFLKKASCPYLLKPFEPKELMKLINTVLLK